MKGTTGTLFQTAWRKKKGDSIRRIRSGEMERIEFKSDSISLCLCNVCPDSVHELDMSMALLCIKFIAADHLTILSIDPPPQSPAERASGAAMNSDCGLGSEFIQQCSRHFTIQLNVCALGNFGLGSLC
jgi:hypothetical protein